MLSDRAASLHASCNPQRVFCLAPCFAKAKNENTFEKNKYVFSAAWNSARLSVIFNLFFVSCVLSKWRLQNYTCEKRLDVLGDILHIRFQCGECPACRANQFEIWFSPSGLTASTGSTVPVVGGAHHQLAIHLHKISHGSLDPRFLKAGGDSHLGIFVGVCISRFSIQGSLNHEASSIHFSWCKFKDS